MIDQLTKPEIQAFIALHLYDDPSKLMLQADRYPDLPMRLIVEQIQSKRKAKTKLPNWFNTEGIIFPPLLSMEQCSSEQTAQYKSSLVQSADAMVDLTGGFGVDFACLSRKFSSALYVERNEALARVAEYNFKQLELSGTQVHVGNSEDILSEGKEFDLIYLDPARRGDRNEKVVLLEDCEPNVIDLLPELLAKSKQVMLKTSPLLDIKGAIRQLDSVSSVHVVALANEVKELVFLLNGQGSTSPKISCVNLQSAAGSAEVFDFTFEDEEQQAIDFETTREYLYEPNAAILKAGAFKAVGNAFGLNKLHQNAHLYTSTQLVEGFPGRVFKVVDLISLNKRVLKKHFPQMKANITTRNFPMTVAQIRKKSGLKEGGDRYLFGTTDQTGRQLALCEKIDSTIKL